MEIQIILLNFICAVISALLTIGFMLIDYRLVDRITHFNTSEQLPQSNAAVGIVVGSEFFGLGIAIGLVIGMGLN